MVEETRLAGKMRGLAGQAEFLIKANISPCPTLPELFFDNLRALADEVENLEKAKPSTHSNGVRVVAERIHRQLLARGFVWSDQVGWYVESGRNKNAKK